MGKALSTKVDWSCFSHGLFHSQELEKVDDFGSLTLAKTLSRPPPMLSGSSLMEVYLQTVSSVTDLLPSDSNIFTVVLTDSSTLAGAETVLGLADLGDNDNYLDICLNLGLYWDMTRFRYVFIQANKIYPPRGTGPNIAHGVKIVYDPKYPYEIDIWSAGWIFIENWIPMVAQIVLTGIFSSGLVYFYVENYSE